MNATRRGGEAASAAISIHLTGRHIAHLHDLAAASHVNVALIVQGIVTRALDASITTAGCARCADTGNTWDRLIRYGGNCVYSTQIACPACAEPEADHV